MKRWIPTLIFLFIIVGLIVRTVQLRNVAFHDWDEGIYATVASELVARPGITTTYNGELWLNKPPLSHMAIAVMLWGFGRGQLWPRMLMAAIASGVLFLLYKLSRYHLQSKNFKMKGLKKKIEPKYIAAVPVLITCSAVGFLDRATLLNTDTLLALSWLGYFVYRKSFGRKLFFLLLGVWSKSLLGFYPLFLELLLVRRTSITLANIKRGLLLVGVPLLWHAYSYVRYGDFFVRAHFFDQLVKRLSVPIELHFGGKLYYPQILLQNLGPNSLFVVVGYIFLLYALFLKDLHPLSIKNSIKKIRFVLNDRQELWRAITVFSPLPIFVMLTFSQSKIAWYMTWLFPLFGLAGLYGVGWLSQRLTVARLAVVLVAGFFFIQFIPETYAFKQMRLHYTKPERTVLAECVGEQQPGDLGFLVNEDERRNRHVLEAAQAQTTTSFMYGGSASFVYYAKRHVDYFYDVESFADMLGQYPYIIVSTKDMDQSPELNAQVQSFVPLAVCTVGEWRLFKERGT